MKTKKYHSIRKQLFLYFTIFATAILMLIWLLQIVLLNSNYTLSRKNTLKRVSNIIQLEYKPDTIQDTVDKYALSNDLCAFLCNERGQIIYLSHYQGISSGRLMAIIKDYQLTELCSKAIKSENKELLGTIRNKNDETEFYVLCKVLAPKEANSKTEVLFLAASLDPMNSTTRFLSNQLLFISAIILILAAITFASTSCFGVGLGFGCGFGGLKSFSIFSNPHCTASIVVPKGSLINFLTPVLTLLTPAFIVFIKSFITITTTRFYLS